MSLRVRDAEAQDIPSLHAIYAHHVLHGFGTFDVVPPTIDEFNAKWRGIVDAGLAWLVAERDGAAVGFAYTSPFRPRTGYRYAVEDSVYIRNDMRGAGVGAALLAPLIKRCEDCGARQVIAVIGDSQNAGSIALHRKFGFEHAGTMKAVGHKLGRWVDIVMMQRALNGGDRTPPPAQPAWRLP